MRSKTLSILCLVSLSTVVVLGAACRTGSPGAPAPTPTPMPPRTDAPETVGVTSTSDEAIHDRVHEALENAPDLDASSIDVRVEDGVVWLSGTVPTTEQHDLAHNVAHGVEGVDRVFHEDLRIR